MGVDDGLADGEGTAVPVQVALDGRCRVSGCQCCFYELVDVIRVVGVV